MLNSNKSVGKLPVWELHNSDLDPLKKICRQLLIFDDQFMVFLDALNYLRCNKIFFFLNWFFKLPTSSHSMQGGGFTYIYTTTQVAVIINSLTPKISLVILLTVCHIVLDVSFENLELDQLIIPQLIVFFNLITCLLDIVLIL